MELWRILCASRDTCGNCVMGGAQCRWRKQTSSCKLREDVSGNSAYKAVCPRRRTEMGSREDVLRRSSGSTWMERLSGSKYCSNPKEDAGNNLSMALHLCK